MHFGLEAASAAGPTRRSAFGLGAAIETQSVPKGWKGGVGG
jgi:hypothetical protein